MLRMPRSDRRPWMIQILKRRGKTRALELVTEVLRQGGEDALGPK